MSVDMLLGAVCQGLLWGVMAIGIYITYRILDYADLTAEGSFTLGAAIAARLITAEWDPLAATLISMLVGTLAGAVTGFFHTALRIPPLLSGILTMTGLYSINLRVMGKANTPLLRSKTLLTEMSAFLHVNERIAGIVVGLIFVAIVIVLLFLFFNTEIGYTLRATGNNENMVKAQGVNTKHMKLLGLIIGNALVALSGALVCQYNSYADISMGTGTIVIGLASVIIGEVIFSDRNSYRALVAVALGSILYRIIIAFVLSLGFPPTDFRLISAVMLAFALSMPLIREKFSFKKQITPPGKTL